MKTFHGAKELLKGLAKSFKISKAGSNMGILSYSNMPQELLPLRLGHDRSVVESYIDKAVQGYGPRNVEGALSMGYAMLVSQKPLRGKHRDASKQLLILVLEGSVGLQGLEALSLKLLASKIKPIVVAVGLQNTSSLLSLVHDAKDLIIVHSTGMMLGALGRLEERMGKNAGESKELWKDLQ